MNDVIEKEFMLIVEDLIRKYDELGMRSSGQWAKSLEVQATEFSGIILGLPYTQQLATGRKPGKFPPIKSIEEWILEKPIRFEPEISISSLAFLIARKIAREGTKYFQEGGTELIESVITPKRIQSIIDKVAAFALSEFETELFGVFEQVAK